MSCGWYSVGRLSQYAAFDKGRGPGDDMQPHGTDQQQHAAAQGIGEIDTCAAQCFGGTAVCHQRVGCQGQQLEEDDKGKQVARQRQADSS